MSSETCSWCGEAVEPDDGWRAYEPAGERRAAFCRLEHVVPWSIQGPHWDAGAPQEEVPEEGLMECAHCGEPVDPEVHVLVVRHRGEHRVTDDFCSVDHLRAWAVAGGRWGS